MATPRTRSKDIVTSPRSLPLSVPRRVLKVAPSAVHPQTRCAPWMSIPSPSPPSPVALASVRCLCSPSGCSRCSGCGSLTRRCYRLGSAKGHPGRRGGRAGVGVGVGCVRCGYKRRANPSMTFAMWWCESCYYEMAKCGQGPTCSLRLLLFRRHPFSFYFFLMIGPQFKDTF